MPTPDPTTAPKRLRLNIRGQVQGVGFRPYIYRTAHACRLTGTILNDTNGVTIEIQGTPHDIQNFLHTLETRTPPVAKIHTLEKQTIPILSDETQFTILPSQPGNAPRAAVTPDIATCPDCLRELNTPGDPRHAYPFINCMHCGPRYSIIKAVPYDRRNTTMSAFTMCPDCQRQYDTPLDRRFHAQPNACPKCGPLLKIVDPNGHPITVAPQPLHDGKSGGQDTDLSGGQDTDFGSMKSVSCPPDRPPDPGFQDPISLAARLLHEGKIIALRGIGGLQIACDARNDRTVQLLRQRKQRPTKPFAVMARSIDDIPHVAQCGQHHSDWRNFINQTLDSPQSPILLLPKNPDADLSPHVAPDNHNIGIMLPTTPLHHLLLAQSPPLLVMTSGNPSSEPLCADNDEALKRLGHIADAFLLHDRDIQRRVDDSVLIAVPPDDSPQPGRPLAIPLRRARGYVPSPIFLTNDHTTDLPHVLALGGDMKSAVCVTRRNEAILSEHLGELHNPLSLRNFADTIQKFIQFFDIQPRAIAHDLHPGYHSTHHADRLARQLGLPLIPVQHHHAHLAAVLAEHQITDQRVIAIIADGTGYGTDNAVWGGEILTGDTSAFERSAHIEYYDLPGGDSAARQTWRPAAAVLHHTLGDAWTQAIDWKGRGVEPEAVNILMQQYQTAQRPLAPTSSTGRLFDAAAFLLELCSGNHHEAQAPMSLENAALQIDGSDTPDIPENLFTESRPGHYHMTPAPIFDLFQKSVKNTSKTPKIAHFFHRALAAMFARTAIRIAEDTGLKTVVLSGGCFANRLLLKYTSKELINNDLKVITHKNTPIGDGALALGQAAVAISTISQGE